MSASPEIMKEYYTRLTPENMAPLWEVLHTLVTREPVTKAGPFQWKFDDVRRLLLEAGGLLTADEAERRVLILENPAYAGQSKATNTLFAGVQLIMPGETAPAHRHTASAVRFFLEGKGAITAVGGEPTEMNPGDFVITPSWAWHDHRNDGDEPCFWLDGLDLPMMNFYEAGFAEPHNDSRQMLSRPEHDSTARFGEGLLPMQAESPYGLTTPIFNYTFKRTRAALVTAAAGQELDPHTAMTLRYANPLDGGWTMPTMSAWMMYVPKGFTTQPMRSTDSMIVAMAEGSGSMKVGDETFDFVHKDTQAVPGWCWRSFTAKEDSFIFFVTDRVAQEKLGFYREEKSPIVA